MKTIFACALCMLPGVIVSGLESVGALSGLVMFWGGIVYHWYLNKDKI